MPSPIWNAPIPDANYEANQAARVAFFNMIAPTPNWKAPIAAWVKAADLEDCREAAVFFAGCTLNVVAVRSDGSEAYVTGAGYYASVGA